MIKTLKDIRDCLKELRTDDYRLIAFDVDDTLTKADDSPRYEIIQILHILQQLGCEIVIWSSHGEDYAKTMATRLGFVYRSAEKTGETPCQGQR